MSSITPTYSRSTRRNRRSASTSIHSIISPVPEETARVACTAFPKGNLYITMCDEIGTLYNDQDFEPLFPTHGQPAECPSAVGFNLCDAQK